MRRFKLLVLILATSVNYALAIEASFLSAEASDTYYSNGFDSEEQFNEWTWERTAPNNYSWYLASAGYIRSHGVAVDDYHNYNADSKYSLAINYGSTIVQDEKGLSPVIDVLPNSNLGFWVCPGVFKYGTYDISDKYDYTVCIVDAATQDTTLVMRGSEHDATTDYQFYHWRHINYDLSAFAGRQIRIQIHYWALGGDSMLFDDFEIIQQGGESADTYINQGDLVHFVNYSTGSNLTYQWSFPGGEPETSTLENPVVRYFNEGSFDVSLTVSDGTASHTCRREGYVNVQAVEPVASARLASNGYYRVGGGCLVANNTWLTFQDRSLNYPTGWIWTLPGSNQEVVDGKEARVYYPNPGYYGYELTASNSAGSNTFSSGARAIKVGGAANYVWNIDDQAASNLQVLKLVSSQGNFAGSNTRRIYRWAEKYERPSSPATLTKVGVHFVQTTTFKPDTTIAVSVNRVGENGFPGEMLAYGTKKLSQCVASAVGQVGEESLTEFTLNKTVSLDEPFFVVIAGIPPYEMNSQGKINNVAIACSPVGDASRGDINTSYVYLDSLVLYNDVYYFINKFHWEENNRETPVSMALSPYLKLQYVDAPESGIEQVRTEPESPAGRFDELYFDLQGRPMTSEPEHGIYLKRQSDGRIEKRISR